MACNSVICRTKYPSTFPNYLIINSAQCAVSIYVPHILVKYIFFGALQQQFLFPCHGTVSINHFPHQFGAKSLPVVWCNHKIHSFDKTQSRFVKGQADWQKFFEQVGASEIWSYIHLHLIEITTLHVNSWVLFRNQR